jgi:hypothetical protein
MGNRHIVIGLLASLLVACGAQAVSQTPQPTSTLSELVKLPSGWTVDTMGGLKQDDIPADAYTGLQESVRATAHGPNQPDNSAATVSFSILLYEDNVAAYDAYMRIKEYKIAEGAEFGDAVPLPSGGEITFAVANYDGTKDKPASTVMQSTTFTCRAVVRFDWTFYRTDPSAFTSNNAIDVEGDLVEEIEQITCGGGDELSKFVKYPDDWTIDMMGPLDPSDIPADANVGLQASFRAIMSEPTQPKDAGASAYFFVLLYEDNATARNAYMLIRTHFLVSGSQINTVESNLPDEEITLAQADKGTAETGHADAVVQATILSCRAIVRYNWLLIDSSASSFFDGNKVVDVQMNSIRNIREATCDGE